MSVKPGLCPLNLVYVMKLRITIEKSSICPLNLVYVRYRKFMCVKPGICALNLVSLIIFIALVKHGVGPQVFQH